MKKKTRLLIVTFLVFYAMIHLGRYLPDLYRGKFSLVDERGYDQRLINLLAEVGISFLFTWSTYISLHLFYPAKKYVFLLVAIAAAFTFCFAFQYVAATWLSADPVHLSRFFRNEILYNVFYVVFAMVFYFIRYSQFKELQQKELNLQNRTSELLFLRSQINPHFLFNNLNNIYSLVYHRSGQSLAAISGLSELLRYMLYDKSETITLDKEIQYLNKYIELEQLRFEYPSKINFSYSDASTAIRLPPLLLLPFIENAFKHGAISFEEYWLDIDLRTDDNGQTVLNCTNRIGVKRKDAVGGIGIENVRKRLELLFPNNHNLDIQQKEDEFRVSLRLGKYKHNDSQRQL